MQAKDIPDLPILQFLHDYQIRTGYSWCTWFWSPEYMPDNSVMWAMPTDTPVNLARYKMNHLDQRGLITGCHCGCRGDYELTDQGRKLISGD